MINFLSTKNKRYLPILVVLCAVVGFCTPTQSLAATISASSDTSIFAKDTVVIGVYLNTEGESINSIDGSVSLADSHQGNFEIKELSLVNSGLSLWPRKPSLDENNTISFVGGIPGGVVGEKVLLFKVVTKINSAGNFTISPTKITAYLNDGLGTPRPITKNTSSIVVGQARENPQDAWKEIIVNDNNAPLPFTIEMIQDPDLYDGKKFLLFETNDAQSGIAYYEVREGNNPPVRSGTQYVLIEQERPVDVTVTAYDKAGNFQVSVFTQKKSTYTITILAVLVGAIIVYFVIKRIRRKRRNG